MYTSSEKRFLAISIVSIITLFTLILAGGVVRSTGSGMGCPDWPKCFDQYIPPTTVSELPANYKVKYVAKRMAKNERFAKILDVLGYADMAHRIRNDLSILKPEEFNAFKTWTEYINRLIGAVYGLMLIACVVFSVTYLKSSKQIFFLSLLNVVLVGFQGWLGSIVVSTNLLSWVVTVHMLLALVILAISIYTYFCARFLANEVRLTIYSKENFTTNIWLKMLAFFCLVIVTYQIALGTMVREQIDEIALMMNNLNRSEWVAKVGYRFNTHRSLAIWVLVLNICICCAIRNKGLNTGAIFKCGASILLLLALQIGMGYILVNFALPPTTQAIHIVLACLLFGAQFYLMLLLGSRKEYIKA